jgi:hypothetical protein
MRKSDRSLVLVLAIPSLVSIFAAIHAYLNFSANGILPPNLQIATVLVAVLTFVVIYVICLSIHAWRF